MKTNPLSRKKYLRALQGALLSLGAPMGWLLVCVFFDPPGCKSPIPFLYMGIGSFLSFTIFGFFIGSSEEVSLKLSLMDHVTGVFNGRYFQLRLSQEYAQAGRNGTPLSLILFDLDFFKAVNDQFGHPAGDLVLREVAQTIVSHVRMGDTTARVGGEEFALLLPETDGPAAFSIAERIRKTLKAASIPLTDGRSAQVTVSAGVVCSRTFPQLLDSDLFEKADQALFDAKQAGRDKVLIAG